MLVQRLERLSGSGHWFPISRYVQSHFTVRLAGVYFLAMFNPHPPLTGFPLVLLVLLAVVEFFRCGFGRKDLDRPADLLLIALAVFTPLTFFSGYFAASDAEQTFVVAPEAIETHRAFGRLLVIFLVPTLLTAVLSRTALSSGNPAASKLNGAYLLFLSATIAVAVYTGYLGGSLVFDHGAGVRANPGSVAPIRP